MGAGAPRRAEDDEALEDQPTPPASPPHRAFCLLSIILLPVLRVLKTEKRAVHSFYKRKS